ncbi:primosomal protein N' [Marinobacter sp. CHS3-4]|uniref:primosomal protein N' n=1 Tax=Marinobacter sp. CHS3-4 TaxID=3045174 RepID=UPI0024B62404|nr:primosomal protein N' [Marinobacter sp. CHS3-4]MDI9246738.1 primosomal protein N' [Marinobacter sp. CHS3-4]
MEPNVPRTASIALNRPLRRLFDYRVPEGMNITLGQRVTIPFGRSRMTGIVAALDQPPPEGIQLKTVEDCCEEWPALPPETFRLLNWASDYYQHALGECLFTALPPALRRGQPARERTEIYWKTISDEAVLPANAKKQKALFDWLKQYPEGVATKQILLAGYSNAQIKSLSEKNLIAATNAPKSHNPSVSPSQRPQLSAEQQVAAEQLATPDQAFSVSLLYGITGSGKTELYLDYLKRHLSAHDQALVLVPEINLTPQTLARFERYFGPRVAVWHSALNDGQKLNAWLKVRNGEPVILIGTRSAVLLPFTNLKTIVVDEEHDSSYKQGDGFRYSARDTAVYRGFIERCPVILGSATPSLESLHNARSGKYQLVRLEHRAGDSKPPEIKLLDIRSRPLEAGFSRPALDAIQRTLDCGQQALVYVNRRGFAPVMMCFDCGHMVECPRCDTRLTYHRRDRAMRCHHCDFQMAAMETCPKCESEAFKPVGQGTERAEDFLAEHFPETPIIRVDRDSTQRKGSIQSIIEKVRTGKPCILVGTQMLAKGHDFPGVTLVVVINADGGLFSVDFRAPEHLVQTLIQVSGRAGRGAQAGQVLVQTCHSDHPLLKTLGAGNYLSISDQLLAERKENHLPPFRAMATFRAESRTMEDSLRLLDSIKSFIQSSKGSQIETWGPLPAVLARRADKHCAQLVLLSTQRRQLNNVIADSCQKMDETKLPSGAKWIIDVDPRETG